MTHTTSVVSDVGGGGMMERCKHENADHLTPGEWLVDLNGDPHRIAQCEQLRCLDCLAWLSLGSANDEPECVKVEIRAAEIAMEPGSAKWCEGCGWGAHETNTLPSPYPTDVAMLFHAGWLAREIATHPTSVVSDVGGAG